MRLNKSRVKTYRRKVEDYWVAVYIEEIEPMVLNIGCCIHKSKRVQNDWYHNKQNKRAKKVSKPSKERGIKGIAECYRLFMDILPSIDKDKALFIYSVQKKNTNAINRYFYNLGFTVSRCEDRCLWIKLPSKYTE